MPSRKSKSHDKEASNHGSKYHQWFTWFACAIAHMSGKPSLFFSHRRRDHLGGDRAILSLQRHLAIGDHTSTTIVTFLMVFLIQNTQNRDTLALQIKLGELS